jgi:predicted HTH transcriptional regulator
MQSLIETICGIANAGPDSDGFIYVGIADKPADAARVATLDKMTPLKFEHIEIVGIDREAKILGIKLDAYVKLFENAFSSAQFTEPLKTQVRAGFDVVTIKGLSVLRIRVPKQSSPSFLADECFFRAGSSTIRATGPQIAAISKQFAG